MENNQLIETLQRNNQLLEELNMRLDLIMGSHNQFPTQLPDLGEKLMTRQQVKDYLGISEATYKRKVRDGSLRPIKMPGGDRFSKSYLMDALAESIRRGRI